MHDYMHEYMHECMHAYLHTCIGAYGDIFAYGTCTYMHTRAQAYIGVVRAALEALWGIEGSISGIEGSLGGNLGY